MQIKKYNNMDINQQSLYLKLTDVLEAWAKSTDNIGAPGLKRAHEVLVSLTMAITAFYIIKNGGVDNEVSTPNRPSNPSVPTGPAEPTGTDPK